MARTFSERFREALSELGVSGAQFARDSGMTRSNVSHWLSGRGRAPSAALAQRAADRLGVNLGWLLTGEGQKRTNPPRTVDRDAPPFEAMEEFGGVELSKQAIRVARAFMDLGARRRKEIERQVIVEAMQETNPIDETPTVQKYEHAPRPKSGADRPKRSTT
jgi:transcriptional regulator with XRE-family HTH domain